MDSCLRITLLERQQEIIEIVNSVDITPTPNSSETTSTPAHVEVKLLLQDTKSKKLILITKNGSCFWESSPRTPWRKPSPEFKETEKGKEEVLSACFRPLSANLSILALGFSTYVVLFDYSLDVEKESQNKTSTRERIIEISSPASLLSWSPRGRMLFFASQNSSLLYCIDGAFGENSFSFKAVGFRNGIKSIGFSSNNNLFVSGTNFPIFKVFDDSINKSEVWTSKGPITFGSWSKDSNKFLCGSMKDGLIIIDIQKNSQWVIVSSENLLQVAKKCDAKMDCEIQNILWDPLFNERILVLFNHPCDPALFSCSKVGNHISSTFLGKVTNTALENSFPTWAEFSLTNRDQIIIGYKNRS